MPMPMKADRHRSFPGETALIPQVDAALGLVACSWQRGWTCAARRPTSAALGFFNPRDAAVAAERPRLFDSHFEPEGTTSRAVAVDDDGVGAYGHPLHLDRGAVGQFVIVNTSDGGVASSGAGIDHIKGGVEVGVWCVGGDDDAARGLGEMKQHHGFRTSALIVGRATRRGIPDRAADGDACI